MRQRDTTDMLCEKSLAAPKKKYLKKSNSKYENEVHAYDFNKQCSFWN